MPGLQDFLCPCWSHLGFDDVGVEDHSLFCFSNSTFDLALFTYTTDDYSQGFGADPVSCSFTNADAAGNPVFENRSEPDLSPEVALDCRAEIQALCGIE